jgi:cytochrome c-type biogenesis protein CcmF
MVGIFEKSCKILALKNTKKFCYMLIEIGHFALVLALIISLVLIVVPSIGIYQNKTSLAQLAKPLVWAQGFWITVAFFVLMTAFLTNDFSVKYVAENSNTQLPVLYKASAVWGSHEGSLLLWVFVLSLWTVAVSIFSKRIPSDLINLTLIVLGAISLGFLLFLLFTSNPFERLMMPPPEGRELNPLLQDFGLAVHPPMLYMGYVGLAIPFAFVLSALIRGKLDSTWIRWTRPWALVSWSFLTIGITLGSWWAYYELGWGGWWFWDPVENASFMPWLVATALIHSLSVSEKRGAFKQWTVLLAIGGFSLSLLGTFLVRSGVLTSVHAFATDPTRGLFILIFLFIVIGGSLVLYTWRSSLLQQSNPFSLLSRETGLLINNILLVTAMLSVLLGTLYPLILDSLNLGKISVGAPYFNAVFVPILIPGILALAVYPYVRWKKDSLSRVFNLLKLEWICILLLTVLSWVFITKNILVIFAIGLFIWVVNHVMVLFLKRLKAKSKVTMSFLGMVIAHLGIAVFVLGATVTTQLGIEKDIKMTIGETQTIAGYDFVFNGVSPHSKDNYSGFIGDISVFKNNKKVTQLKPEKRLYQTGMPMTEASIDPSITRDLYVALGESLEGGAWSVRIYYKPLVRWIWLGGLMIALGALIAAIDRRYFMRPKQ